jgi:hypothetical protein
MIRVCLFNTSDDMSFRSQIGFGYQIDAPLFTNQDFTGFGRSPDSK